MSESHILKHFSMLHMAIHVDQLLKCTILIKFVFQTQFVTFIRGHPWTPIHPAPVLVALPFQTKGEVGCEALSSYSRTGFGSSDNTATPQWSSSVKQPCDERRGMRESYERPQRCHAASKRKARGEGPRPRGRSGAVSMSCHVKC